ncbi:C6 zinc finger domain-containing protein [Colletotrichum paranaense]|uniref:C6 zinc finger domain-containing protein n=1 Tax=Colletotrichum paranaense TaxID=1914294 RepID=A0ABQ9SDF4_9PEZI|nr:C6 zinc finger domain-containing protein [Colletotrichum paranaense]KAK1533300.1 C6 zinc finger domain-containing protein [Colletotrichum paranaense]
MQSNSKFGGKIPKACEPCRRRKIKCSGHKPCRQCENKPSDCVYRLKPRVRLSSKRAAVTVANAETGHGVSTPGSNRVRRDEAASQRSAEELQQHVAQTEVYHSVAAAHHAPKSTDSSQLFYGPSSNSAFLQQIHRGLLSGQYGQSHARDVQEGGPGLDMFMQRNIFFGMPLKINVEPAQPASCPVSLLQAEEFVLHFKTTHLSSLPFFTPPELDDMVPTLFNYTPETTFQPQRKTVFLAALALGALGTSQTDAAESLFIHAKKEAAIYEDSVTLPMIQFSILMAHYQLNMGRPNSAYLHSGIATRKALSMGLHAGTTSAISRKEEVQGRLVTLWSLYFLEIWLSLVVGRRSSMQKSDFESCPYPDGQPTLMALCQFANILEEAIESIYNKRTDSLRQLYGKAEKLYGHVRQYGEKWGLGTAASVQRVDAWNPETSLLLHNVYFHVVLLIFRPFLIAEAALQSGEGSGGIGDIWLRQACRHATDAAQDALAFTWNMLRGPEECNTRRYHAFFIESSCAVLLYDSLRHPAKHPHNLEFIQMAISCLRSLVGDDPVTNAIHSIKRIVWAVEQSINAAKSTGAFLDVASADSSPSWTDDRLPTNIQFPSLEENRATTSDDLIFFSNRAYRPQPEPITEYSMPMSGSVGNPFPDLNFDVLTTDLFNFFPVEMNSGPTGHEGA